MNDDLVMETAVPESNVGNGMQSREIREELLMFNLLMETAVPELGCRAEESEEGC